MSRTARTRSSLAFGIVFVLGASIWFAGRQLARAGETPDRSASKDTVIAAVTTPGAKAAGATRTAVFPVPDNFKVKLLRAGLDPKALCAAGVASNSVLATLQAAADIMNGAPSALASADASYAGAHVTADALARKIQSGKASQEEVAGYPAAQSALQAADVARASVLDGYFSAANESLPNAQRTALASIRANSAWGLPAEYLVVTRSEADWVALRDALSNEHIAVELPDTLSQSCQALLATVRADPTVAAARTAVQNSLTTLTASWNTAVGD